MKEEIQRSIPNANVHRKRDECGSSVS